MKDHDEGPHNRAHFERSHRNIFARWTLSRDNPNRRQHRRKFGAILDTL
jgi:hypothetical protein